jgi:cytochrome b6-f complex iron-sulfur subunit
MLQGIGAAVAGSVLASACGGGGNDAVDASIDAPPGTCPPKDLCLDITKAPNTALANVNGAVVVSATAGKLIVVRTSPTAVVALSDICTHQGCAVTFQATNQLLYCPCHGAEFSLTGAVTRGPATTPLKTYSATLAGNIVTIVVG